MRSPRPTGQAAWRAAVAILPAAKRAAMMAGRYAHAKQFNRHRRELRLLRTRLDRIIRDIRRRIAGNAGLEATFEWPLTKASQIRSQQQRQRGFKLYSFHAPEVECIGKGKASAPYEFGAKASIITTNAAPEVVSSCCTRRRCRAILAIGHMLSAVIATTERLTGCAIERAYVDKGYRGTTRPIHAASSSPAKRATYSTSSASSGAAWLSKPSSGT